MVRTAQRGGNGPGQEAMGLAGGVTRREREFRFEFAAINAEKATSRHPRSMVRFREMGFPPPVITSVNVSNRNEATGGTAVSNKHDVHPIAPQPVKKIGQFCRINAPRVESPQALATLHFLRGVVLAERRIVQKELIVGVATAMVLQPGKVQQQGVTTTARAGLRHELLDERRAAHFPGESGHLDALPGEHSRHEFRIVFCAIERDANARIAIDAHDERPHLAGILAPAVTLVIAHLRQQLVGNAGGGPPLGWAPS